MATPITCSKCEGRGAFCADAGDSWACRPARFEACDACSTGPRVRDGALKLRLEAVAQTAASYGADADAASRAILAFYPLSRPAGASNRVAGFVAPQAQRAA